MCLYDTGSSYNLLCKDYFDVLCENPNFLGHKMLCAYNADMPVVANGSPMQIIGQVSFSMQIAGVHRTVSFLVTDHITEPCIFGRPGIDLFGTWKYSPHANKYVLRGRSVPLVDPEGKSELLATVLAEDEIIPPRTAKYLRLKLPKHKVSDSEMLFIEPDSNFSDKTSLVALCSVVERKGLVGAKVYNFSNEPVCLKAESAFGTAEAVEYSDKNSSCKKGQSSNVNFVSNEDRIEFLKKNLNLSDSALSNEQQDDLRDLIFKYADIFSTGDHDLGETGLVEHMVDTGNSKPIYQRPYRAEHLKRAVIEKEVNKMLENNIIEPSNSAWSSPVVLVTKKDGSIRFCVNYIRLNDVTVRDTYCLPRIDDILQSLGKSAYFTSLDLASGYWQIKMSDKLDSKAKTTFCCFLGTFQFKRMPFGLKNAPMTFQRLLERVLAGLLYDNVYVYIDDILVTGSSWAEHLSKLRAVFYRLRAANLKLKLKKCDFGKIQTDYLGHLVNADGIKVNPNKVEKVQNFVPPTSKSGVRRFLGMCNYYAKFIWRYSDYAQVLHSLTGKNADFVWTEECQRSFDHLKQALCNAPVLVYPNFSAEFRVYIDASEVALGSVLCQLNDDGDEQPISFYSRCLVPAERRYTNTEREILAVCESLKNFRPYIYAGTVTCFTDHQAILRLLRSENPSQRLAKWQFTLMGQTDWSVRYVQGKKNVVADCLSRIPNFSLECVSTTEDSSVSVITRSMAKDIPADLFGLNFPV